MLPFRFVFPKTRVSTFVKAAPQVRREDLQANLEKIAEAQELGAMWRIEAADPMFNVTMPNGRCRHRIYHE